MADKNRRSVPRIRRKPPQNHKPVQDEKRKKTSPTALNDGVGFVVEFCVFLLLFPFLVIVVLLVRLLRGGVVVCGFGVFRVVFGGEVYGSVNRFCVLSPASSHHHLEVVSSRFCVFNNNTISL